jgi:hypothetical protein
MTMQFNDEQLALIMRFINHSLTNIKEQLKDNETELQLINNQLKSDLTAADLELTKARFETVEGGKEKLLEDISIACKIISLIVGQEVRKE